MEEKYDKYLLKYNNLIKLGCHNLGAHKKVSIPTVSKPQPKRHIDYPDYTMWKINMMNI